MIPEDKDERLREFIRNYRTASETEKKNRNGMTRGIKVLLIAAIILLIAVFTAFAFEPIRSFVFKVYSDCTEFVFHSGEKSEGDYLYAVYTYIPEEYVLVSNTKAKLTQEIVYKNGNNRIIIQSGDNSDSVLIIDTENAEHGEMQINNYDGYYSITDRSIILTWSSGKYNHVILADKCDAITLDEVVYIAQSAIPASW